MFVNSLIDEIYLRVVISDVLSPNTKGAGAETVAGEWRSSDKGGQPSHIYAQTCLEHRSDLYCTCVLRWVSL